jgi:photosystem II stability/assembly factor-like uncharacterized protein
MKIISYFFFTLFIYSSVGISQWTNYFNIPDANWVGRLEVVDENVLWGLMSFNNGVSGFIHTTDGGENWYYDSLKCSFISAIYSRSASSAYIALFDSLNIARIIKTSDGGITWNIQPTAFGQIESWIDYVYFFDDLNGFAFGDPIGGYCEIYTTTNGGDNWIQVPNTNIPPSLNNEYPTWFSYSVYENSIWIPVVVQNQKKCRIFKSTDRGYTWSATDQFSISSTLNILPTSIVFKNHSEGILVFSDYYASQSEYVIYKTTNGGMDWSILNFPISIEPAFISNIRGSSSGYFVSAPLNNSGTAYTTDSGNNWTQVDNKPIWDVDMITPSSGWAAASPTTNQAIIYKWNESPKTGWYLQNSGTSEHFSGVRVIDENTATAVGTNGSIFRTTDAGVTWRTQTSGTSSDLIGVFFIDVNNGYVVGANGTILHTTNGGSNWINLTSSPTSYLFGVYFINENIGSLAGLDGIWFTSNGGTTWTKQTTGSNEWLFAIHMTDANIITAVGNSGTILRTTNGGNSWSSQVSGTNSNLTGIYFANTTTGIASGGYGTIRQTTDGGTTWNGQTSGTTSFLYDLSFTDSNNGTVIGQDGTIIRTTNGGATWTMQTSGTSNNLSGVSFLNSNLGTAVGSYGTILRTTNGGVSFVEEEQINEVPTEFLLSQNYPNPFNPNTTLRYSIPKSTQVTLKIFNALGEELEILVNDEKSIGTYELNWNASRLPSGIYFYQINTGGFIETKKMIFLK